jgi:hypothetical protein
LRLVEIEELTNLDVDTLTYRPNMRESFISS